MKLPEIFTQPGYSVIVGLDLQFVCICVGFHGSEFDAIKGFSIASGTFLNKKRPSTGVDHNHQRNDGKQPWGNE